MPSEPLFWLKNSIELALGLSTSAKTAPKPLIVAGVVVPGKKKVRSTILLPSGVNNRCGEKVVKILG